MYQISEFSYFLILVSALAPNIPHPSGPSLKTVKHRPRLATAPQTQAACDAGRFVRMKTCRRQRQRSTDFKAS